MAVVTKKCYFSNTTKIIPFDFYSSQSSYGSHKNRNFETRSHRNSVDDLRNEKEQEKLALLIMNGNGAKHTKNGGILSKHGGSLTLNLEKPQRSVVIDDEDIDAYSPDYGDEEETEQEDAKMLLDEDEARMRYSHSQSRSSPRY